MSIERALIKPCCMYSIAYSVALGLKNTGEEVLPRVIWKDLHQDTMLREKIQEQEMCTLRCHLSNIKGG